MKGITKVILLSAVAGMAMALPVAAQNTYFKVDAGVSFPDDVEIKEIGGISLPMKPEISFDLGFRVDVAGGFKLSEAFAIELEAGAVWNEADTISLDGFGEESLDMTMWQVPIMANLVYTIPLQSKFKPYLGAGAGGVFTLLDIEDESENDFSFGYQAMAGINYEMSDSMHIGLGYKFLGTLEQEFDDVTFDPIFTHAVLLNFVFKF